MMKIVRPHCVASITAFVSRQDDFPIVARILTDYESSQSLNLFSDFLDQMLGRIVRNSLRRIEPEPINVEFFYPINRILAQEISNRS